MNTTAKWDDFCCAGTRGLGGESGEIKWNIRGMGREGGGEGDGDGGG